MTFNKIISNSQRQQHTKKLIAKRRILPRRRHHLVITNYLPIGRSETPRTISNHDMY